MTGVIWFVQIVHYPLFASVGASDFPEYERRHANRTGYVVAPVMTFELGASFVLAWIMRPTQYAVLGSDSLALVVLLWVSTFALQVPCHNRLARGYVPADNFAWCAPTGFAPSAGLYERPCWSSCGSASPSGG
jgi:hypothetical protein